MKVNHSVMLDNSVNSVAGVTGPDVKQNIIPFKVNQAEWRKERHFLKDRNQLETVLGPSRGTWFDELTEKALLCKKEVMKENKTVFDSPVCSPSVSQLIKNQLKVGHSPPQFYHSSPALGNKLLFDDVQFSTPDNHGHWCRPTLGISPSPVQKDGSFFRRNSSNMGSLGLSNEDSVLSWSNSLATPPRDDSTIIPIGCTPTQHKDPVRALFSSSPHQDTTSESLEPLESTNEEDIQPDEDDDETTDPKLKFSFRTSETKTFSNEINQVLSKSVSIPNEKSMDAWRDKFRRKLILKSDSFGKKISSPDLSYHSQTEDNKKRESQNTFNHNCNQLSIDTETEKCSNEEAGTVRMPVETVEENMDINKELNKVTENISGKSENEETCVSPVFPKHSIDSGQRSTKYKKVRSRTEVVGAALSDFFDSPAGAVGKRSSFSKKRKSSEMFVTEFDENVNNIESVLSTPKTVVLQSILMKNKHSRSSSGKKVRFSESVLKYSEEKAKNGSFSKKRRKHLHEKKSTVLDEQISIENKDSDNETNKGLDIKDLKSNDISDTLNLEGDDVFSQVSPTALEAMCSAALISCGSNKTEVTCADDNSLVKYHEQKIFDPGKDVLKETPSKKNVLNKKFLYPSKHNLVKSNQSEIFEYKEDKRGDHKGKFIVNAIEGCKILGKKDKPVQIPKKEDDREQPGSKVASNSMNIDRVGDEIVMDDQSTYLNLRNSEIGKLETAGFQSASGKDISLTDDAVMKAKKLLDEQQSYSTPFTTYKNDDLKTIALNSDLTKTDKLFENDKYRTYLKEYDEEDFESELWCEDFDINHENLDPVEDDKHEIEYLQQYKGITENRNCEAMCKVNEVNESIDRGLNGGNLSLFECEIHNNKEKKDLKIETHNHDLHFSKTESSQSEHSENSKKSSVAPSYKYSSSADLICQPNAGFSTASGKILQFDIENLKKAEHIFSSTENLYHEHLLTESSTANLSNDQSKKHIGNRNSLTNFSCEHEQMVNASSLMGSTDSGKSFVLTKSTMKRAQKMLKEDVPLESSFASAKEQSIDMSSMTGFTTATGKNLSKTYMENAQNILVEDTQLESEFSSESNIIKVSHSPEQLADISNITGFTTASGKAFDLSNTAMDKTQNILRKEMKLESDISCKKDTRKLSSASEHHSGISTGFTSASGKVVKLSKIAMEKAKSMLKEETKMESNFEFGESITKKSVSTEQPVIFSNMTGFTTASGKAFSLSKNAMEKAQNMLKEGPHSECTKIFKAHEKERPNNIQLHELFKEELENSNKAMDMDLLKQEIVSLKSTLVKPNSASDVTKTNGAGFVVKASGFMHINTNKPKGFRPFKAPKRITGKLHDSSSQSLACKVTTSSNEPEIKHLHSSPDEIKTRVSIHQTNRKLVDDQDGDLKIRNKDKNLSEKVQEKISNVTATQDIYEGIFSQMFADDMELEESSTGGNTSNKNEDSSTVNTSMIRKRNMHGKDVETFNTTCDTIEEIDEKIQSAKPSLPGSTAIQKGFESASGNEINDAMNLACNVSQELQKERSKYPVLKSKHLNDTVHSSRLSSGLTSKSSENQISGKCVKMASAIQLVPDQLTEKNTVQLKQDENEQIKKTLNDELSDNVNIGFIENLADSKHDSDKNPCFGFQTAKGEKISISKDALEAARNNFDSEQSVQKVDTMTLNNRSIPTELLGDTKMASNVTEMPSNKMMSVGIGTAGFKPNQTIIETNELSNNGGKEFKTLEETFLNVTDKSNLNATDKSVKSGFVTLNDDGVASNKQMFLGFHTAGGKKIKISESAKVMARETLKDTEKFLVEQNLVEIKEDGEQDSFILGITEEKRRKSKTENKPDMSSTFELQSEKQKDIEDSDRVTEVAIETTHFCENQFNRPPALGFHTAAGKSIMISGRSLEGARQFLNKEENILPSLVNMEFQTAMRCGTKQSDMPLKEAERSMNVEEEILSNLDRDILISDRSLEEARQTLDLEDDTQGKPPCMGFHTAGRKVVVISDRALEEARKNLNKEDNYSDNPAPIKDPKPGEGFKTVGGEVVEKSNSVLEEVLNSDKKVSDCPPQNGFNAAGGNDNINSESPSIENREFLNIEEKIEEYHVKEEKNINTSSKTMGTAVRILLVNKENEVAKHTGFQIAGSKDVSSSVKAITTQNDEDTFDDGQHFIEFMTERGEGIKTLNKSVEEGKKTMGDKEEISDGQKFIGFQTARGKDISISEKALEKTREKFKSEDQPFEKIFLKTLEKTNSHRKAAETDFDSLNPVQNILFGPLMGFQTAGQKDIIVSDIALKEANKMLDDTKCSFEKSELDRLETIALNNTGISESMSNISESSLNIVNSSEGRPDFLGFQTAGGNNIIVSEKALKAARNNLSSEEGNFKGFQSAAGKTITVSEEALMAARKSLNSSDDKSHCSHTGEKSSNVSVSHKSETLHLGGAKSQWKSFRGFQTASGSKISFSNEALQAARKHLNSDKEVLVQPLMTGFQTAKGNKVELSVDSLNKARETLSKVDNERHGLNTNILDETLPGDRKHCKSNREFQGQTLMTGFQTARGSKVEMSANSLKKAQETLSSVDDKRQDSASLDDVTRVSTIINAERVAMDNLQGMYSNDIATKTSGHFAGFQTASGTNVKVSDKGLEYSRAQHTQSSDEFLSFHSQPLSHDVDNISSNDIATKINGHFKGFQSASGTNVQISDKMLERAKGQLVEGVLDRRSASSSSSLDDEEIKILRMLDSELTIKRQKLGCQQERHIVHKQGIAESQMKRKPLRSAPEGITTDRRHPGFRPFKPVICRKIDNQQKQSKEVIASKPAHIAEVKTPFQTPYKKFTTTKSPDKTDSQVLVSTKTPVFSSKLKHSLCNQIENDVGKNFTGNSFKHTGHETPSEIKLSENGVCENLSRCSMSVPRSKICESSVNHVQQREVSLLETECVKKVGSHDLMMETSDMSSFSQDEDDVYYCNLVEARTRQDEIINHKKKIEPVTGRLYELKKRGGRIKLADVFTKNENKIKKKIRITSTTAEEYKFEIRDDYGNQSAHVLLGDGAFLVPDDDGKAGKQEFNRAFLTMSGVDSKLISDVWLYNHYRWIVWKLAAYELTSCFAGRSLTPENVMLQLKYRYDREIDRAERSCLKKIYEKDDTPSKRLVLCVSNLTYNKDKVTNVSNPDLPKVLVQMTDGWYKIPVQFDGPLTELSCQGRIKIGQKLCITGAELVGSQDACTPLEAPADLHLKININCTRPAKWDCRLGYQTDPRPLCVPIVSLYEEGGNLGVIDVVLVRKYPILYMEKLSAGGCVFRTQRDEERVQQQCHTRKQVELEKLYNQIQKEMEQEQIQETSHKKGTRKYSIADIEQLSTGEEISDVLENSIQPDRIQNYLSGQQQGLLYDYQRCLQDEKQHKLNMRVQSAWQDREDEAPTERNVTPVLKFRVAGCANTDLDSQKSTILTVWRPAAEVTELKEGKRYKIYSLSASTSRSKYTGSSVQMTATKQTKFMQLEIDENLLDCMYEPREVLLVNDLKRRQPPFGELDFVGLVVRVVPASPNDSVRRPDMMYLADCQSNILGVKFWNGLKNFGEDICTEGTFVCLSNLMDKSTYRYNHLPTVEATPEFTNITCKPQNSGQRHALDKLQSILKNKPSFKDDVAMILDDMLSNEQQRNTFERNHTTGFKRQNSSLQSTLASDTVNRVTSHKRERHVCKDNENLTGNEEMCLKNNHELILSEEAYAEGEPDDVKEQNIQDRTDDKVSVKITAPKESIDDVKESPAKRLKNENVVSKTCHTPLVTGAMNSSSICATPARNTDNENTATFASQNSTPASQSKQSQVQSRLAKLSMYGTPDILSPLPVSIPRSVSKGFNPPSFRKKLN